MDELNGATLQVLELLRLVMVLEQHAPDDLERAATAATSIAASLADALSKHQHSFTKPMLEEAAEGAQRIATTLDNALERAIDDGYTPAC